MFANTYSVTLYCINGWLTGKVINGGMQAIVWTEYHIFTLYRDRIRG